MTIFAIPIPHKEINYSYLMTATEIVNIHQGLAIYRDMLAILHVLSHLVLTFVYKK